MSDAPHTLDVRADTEWEIESEEGSLWTGSRILIGIVAMAWIGVAFSYFYLRSLDGPKLWHPHFVPTPSLLIGTMIMLCVVLRAAVLSYGTVLLRRGLAFEWFMAGWLAVLGGLIATGLQVWALTRTGFYPGESGYTSVYIGFGLLDVGFLFTGTLWSETVVARSMRLRERMLPHEFFGLSVQPEVRLLRSSLRGCGLYSWFMAAVLVFFWFLFYILR